MQRVGDLALDGKEGTDDVFGKIDQVEYKLAEDYFGLDDPVAPFLQVRPG